MAEPEITTDVESCYLVTCANNNALKCGLIRIHVSVEGTCMGFAAIEAVVEEEPEEEPHH